MAGQILGVYFKSIIGTMLASTTELLFPEHRRRIAEMQDDLWYPWEDYVQMTNDLHARLSDASLQAIGQATTVKTLPLNKAAGFDSVERVFRRFEALSADVIRGVPPEESLHTVSFTEDSAVLEGQTRLPIPLLLGFFRGILIGFGRVLLSEEVTQDGSTTRITLKWS
ncbi:hypothetical protein [Hyalangium rubrum]|uniref:Heme NO-binding domain-containing protein n=1 Tax=Hyalangium rubrum TaxID=3103134 RepID=A0ABU5HHA5_9BACT|nr:hypothetical protein [Hyalangium sp. s54d21]MDY7232212.1 hypothetical protein [Hyalangium sp. s54d21]